MLDVVHRRGATREAWVLPDAGEVNHVLVSKEQLDDQAPEDIGIRPDRWGRGRGSRLSGLDVTWIYPTRWVNSIRLNNNMSRLHRGLIRVPGRYGRTLYWVEIPRHGADGTFRRHRANPRNPLA